MNDSCVPKKRVVICPRDCLPGKPLSRLKKALEEELGFEVALGGFNEKMYPAEGVWAMDNANMEKEICDLSAKMICYPIYKAYVDLRKAESSVSVAEMIGERRGKHYSIELFRLREELREMERRLLTICNEEEAGYDDKDLV